MDISAAVRQAACNIVSQAAISAADLANRAVIAIVVPLQNGTVARFRVLIGLIVRSSPARGNLNRSSRVAGCPTHSRFSNEWEVKILLTMRNDVWIELSHP